MVRACKPTPGPSQCAQLWRPPSRARFAARPVTDRRRRPHSAPSAARRSLRMPGSGRAAWTATSSRIASARAAPGAIRTGAAAWRTPTSRGYERFEPEPEDTRRAACGGRPSGGRTRRRIARPPRRRSAAGSRAGGGDDRPAARAAAGHHARGRRLDRPAGVRRRAAAPPAAALGRPGRGSRVRRQLRRPGVRRGGYAVRLRRLGGSQRRGSSGAGSLRDPRLPGLGVLALLGGAVLGRRLRRRPEHRRGQSDSHAGPTLSASLAPTRPPASRRAAATTQAPLRQPAASRSCSPMASPPGPSLPARHDAPRRQRLRLQRRRRTAAWSRSGSASGTAPPAT